MISDQDKAEDVMNDAKESVIEDGLKDENDIQDAVEDAAKNNDVTLTQEQIDKITELLKNISQISTYWSQSTIRIH